MSCTKLVDPFMGYKTDIELVERGEQEWGPCATYLFDRYEIQDYERLDGSVVLYNDENEDEIEVPKSRVYSLFLILKDILGKRGYMVDNPL